MKEIIILIYINFKESSIKKVIQIDYVLGVNKIKALHKYLIKKKLTKFLNSFLGICDDRILRKKIDCLITMQNYCY